MKKDIVIIVHVSNKPTMLYKTTLINWHRKCCVIFKLLLLSFNERCLFSLCSETFFFILYSKIREDAQRSRDVMRNFIFMSLRGFFFFFEIFKVNFMQNSVLQVTSACIHLKYSDAGLNKLTLKSPLRAERRALGIPFILDW